MKASELRPGNIFLFIGENFPEMHGKFLKAHIIGPRTVGAEGFTFHEKNIAPVLITNDVLLGFGLRIEQPSTWFGNGQDFISHKSQTIYTDYTHLTEEFFVREHVWRYKKNEEDTAWDDTTVQYEIHREKWFPKAVGQVMCVSYAHELQNIFQLLFKKELTLTK